jgi:hypothetical protein
MSKNTKKNKSQEKEDWETRNEKGMKREGRENGTWDMEHGIKQDRKGKEGSKFWQEYCMQIVPPWSKTKKIQASITCNNYYKVQNYD